MKVGESQRSIKLKSWLRSGVIYLLIFVLAGFLGNLWLSRNQTTGQAPEISGQNLQNGHWQTVKLSDFEGPVLVYFFADWCPICKIQHHTIKSINKTYPVIAIAMQSGSLENVRDYVKEQQLNSLFVLNDESGSISRAFGVNGVPSGFIIDGSNEIRFSTRGYATLPGLISRLWLAELD